MQPALRHNQVVLVVPKHRYRPSDVVMLAHDGLEKIKRVHAVEQGRYDVRGDNPERSTDSRQFGLVSGASLLGKVIWPRV